MIKTTQRIKRLFYDIEVSPNIVLAFRAGYDQIINHDAIIQERKIICIGYKWEGEKDVNVLRWSRDQDDRHLLAAFLSIASEADELVAHFGDRFDLPWIRTRALLLRLDPLPFFKTIDTKAWASKNFYFNSNKLDYLSSVLGHGRKLETDFGLWKRVLIDNDKKSLDYMCKYCGVDVIKLEKVYHDFAPLIKPKTHAGVVAGRDKWTCPRCGSMNVHKYRTRVSASGTVTHQMKCNEDGSFFTISDSVYKAYQEYRRNKKP